MTEDEIRIIWEGLSGCEIWDGRRNIFVAFCGVRARFGPDFRSATVFVDGTRIEGDVECHVFSSDWYRHGHHRDPVFSSVRIHVVFEDDVKLDALTISLKEIGALNVAGEFMCRATSENDRRGEVFRTAFVRLQRKAGRIKERASEVGEEQALYEFVAESLGYERFRNVLLLFARRYPYDVVIRSNVADLFSEFMSRFRVLGRVPSRPRNSPEMRVKNLADFVRRNHPISKKVVEFFDARRSHRIWERDFLVSGLGVGRFRTMVANVFIPYLLTVREATDVLSFFLTFPPEEMNRFIRIGSEILDLRKINIIEGQGIIEIFGTRCSRHLCYLCPLRR